MKKKISHRLKLKKKVTFPWSIGIKLTVIFLVVVTLPMMFTAYYNLNNAKGLLNDLSEENLIDLSCSTSQQIDLLLIENKRTSATLAGEPIVIEFLKASEAERLDLISQVNQTLQNYADNHPDYDAPGILDKNGIVIASLEPILIGKNRSFRDYFQASIKGESFVSDILVGRATGRAGVFLTNPVNGSDGEILGINIIWLKANAIRSIINDIEVGEEGIAYLLDHDGVIIAHNKSELLYHSLNELSPESKEIINSTVRFGTINETDIPLIPESLEIEDLANELVLNKKSSTYRYYSPIDNSYHIVGYTHLENHSWTVVVDLPESQYLAPLQYLELMTWLTAGLIIIIVLVISILLVRSITRPIRRLTEAAISVEKFQTFDPSVVGKIASGRDEIAHLGRVFKSMVLSLRQELIERKEMEKVLKKTLKNLERSNKDLEEFAFIASHDLQEPLRMVASFTKLLAKRYKDKLDEDANDFIKYAVDGAIRMQNLIEGLLSYSRITTRGKLFNRIDVNSIMDKVILNLKNSIEETETIITYDVLPTILGDESQIEQLFQNLIQNSIKFRRNGIPPQIHISSKKQKKEWIFSVNDNGIGIDSQYFDRIFVIFQRLHLRNEYSGSGLGLALCKKIILRHGGKIWVESKIGEGSTFYFTIPIEKNEIEEE